MTTNDLLARTIDRQQLDKLNAILIELTGIKLAVAQPDNTTIILPSTTSDYELGRRLGSIMTLDNQGKVFWFDDFESSTLKWTIAYETTGSNAASLDYAHSYDQSWKITNDGLDSATTITKPFPTISNIFNMGFEISLMPDPANTPANINIYLRKYDGTNLHEASMRWELSTGIIRGYEPTNALFIAFTPGVPDIRLNEWYTLKLAATFQLNNSIYPSKYLYMNFNGKQVDLSLIPVNVTANATAKHIEVVVYIESGATGICYVDDAIITLQESL